MAQPLTDGRPQSSCIPFGLSSGMGLGRAGVLLAILVATGCAAPDGFGGPLAVRNQHPAQLTVLRLEPAGSTTLPAGRHRADLSLSYTSLFLRGTSATDTFVMDGEILRAQWGGHYGLTDRLQLDFALPVAHTTGGFLDHTVEQWHALLNTPESGRDRVFDNQFQVRATRDGQTVYELAETGLALMDVPVGLTWQLAAPTPTQPLGLAVRGAIELPTGDADRGFGNGGVDAAIGVVGEVRVDRVTVTGHLEYAWAHTPRRAAAAGVPFGDVISAGIGLEAPLTRDTHALVQLEIDQSVLRNLDRVHTDHSQLLLWVGVRSRLQPGWWLELGFGEDMTHETPPDFTAYLGLRVGPDPAGN